MLMLPTGSFWCRVDRRGLSCGCLGAVVGCVGGPWGTFTEALHRDSGHQSKPERSINQARLPTFYH